MVRPSDDQRSRLAQWLGRKAPAGLWRQRLRFSSCSARRSQAPLGPSAMLPAASAGMAPLLRRPGRSPGPFPVRGRVIAPWVVHVPLRACELTPAPGKAVGGVQVKREAPLGRRILYTCFGSLRGRFPSAGVSTLTVLAYRDGHSKRTGRLPGRGPVAGMAQSQDSPADGRHSRYACSGWSSG